MIWSILIAVIPLIMKLLELLITYNSDENKRKRLLAEARAKIDSAHAGDRINLNIR